MTLGSGLQPRRRRSPAAWAEALRSLAALLRSGTGTRKALVDWHQHAPDELAPILLRLSRLLLLGAPVEQAISGIEADLDSEGTALASVFAAHRHLGGDLARTLDSLARQIERRQAFLEAARAAGAGAVLSGRIVAGLPLLFLLFGPARAPLFDGVGLTTLAVGGALGIGGLVWIERLVPSPDLMDDPGALVGEVAAGVLDGGSGLSVALDVISQSCPVPIRPRLRSSSTPGGTRGDVAGRAFDVRRRKASRACVVRAVGGQPGRARGEVARGMGGLPQHPARS